ncbi:hypothetical protein Tco_0849318 [Tanacetum coccineum]
MKKNLKSHALTMKEEMVKESNAKIAKMFAQYAQQLPVPLPSKQYVVFGKAFDILFNSVTRNIELDRLR